MFFILICSIWNRMTEYDISYSTMSSPDQLMLPYQALRAPTGLTRLLIKVPSRTPPPLSTPSRSLSRTISQKRLDLSGRIASTSSLSDRKISFCWRMNDRIKNTRIIKFSPFFSTFGPVACRSRLSKTSAVPLGPSAATEPLIPKISSGVTFPCRD